MTPRRPVKSRLALAPLAVLALAPCFACSGARPAADTARAQVVAVDVDAGAAGGPRREARAQQLVAPTAAELVAVRPLLARGPVFLVRNADGGADARITILAHTRAPVAAMHRTITTPGDYATFMPILRGVDVLSTHGSRTAFRFHVAAPLFDVTALCAMNDLSERRVDVVISQSETGPGGSRWDLTPEPDGGSIVALTTWGDPSQGHWLLRQVARRSPSAIAGMNISVDTVLALGAARRAEILSGERLPMRPAEGIAPTGELAPPEAGPWLGLTRDATLLSMSLTPDGAVRQVTVGAWTAAAPEAVIERLRDVANYPRVWGSVQRVDVLASAPGDAPGSTRYHVVIDTPLTHIEGTQVLRIQGNVAWQDGVGGDLADSGHRYDVVAAPGGGAYVLFTGGSDYNRAGWVTRALMERDTWLMAGFAGSWKIVWLRNLLRGV